MQFGADWQKPRLFDERLRATLGFLETLTLRPSELSQAAAAADLLLSTGVSEEALVDAGSTFAALFNMIDRLADSLGWHVPSDEAFSARAPAMLESGYALATVPDTVEH